MNMEIPAKEGFVSFRGYQVWYRIVGDHEGPEKLPLLCLHGGPGATHDYLEPVRVNPEQALAFMPGNRSVDRPF